MQFLEPLWLPIWAMVSAFFSNWLFVAPFFTRVVTYLIKREDIESKIKAWEFFRDGFQYVLLILGLSFLIYACQADVLLSQFKFETVAARAVWGGTLVVFCVQFYHQLFGRFSFLMMFHPIAVWVLAYPFLFGHDDGRTALLAGGFLWIFVWAVVFWIKRTVGQVALRVKEMKQLSNFAAAIIILLLCFAGFALFDSHLKLVLWFLFLLLAYPMVVAFVIGLSTGSAKFTDRVLFSFIVKAYVKFL